MSVHGRTVYGSNPGCNPECGPRVKWGRSGHRACPPPPPRRKIDESGLGNPRMSRGLAPLAGVSKGGFESGKTRFVYRISSVTGGDSGVFSRITVPPIARPLPQLDDERVAQPTCDSGHIVHLFRVEEQGVATPHRVLLGLAQFRTRTAQTLRCWVVAVQATLTRPNSRHRR